MRISERTRAYSSSVSIGLLRKSSAPAPMASMRVARSCTPLTRTTGVRHVSAVPFTAAQTSTPEISGITTSSSTRSGRSRLIVSSASCPFIAVMTE